ncbi:hypothetical protein AB833_10720 [Chromatiales bacterium (ex Bugula neritina AB1)]|nr:hypothetical protein AB833_10720 [Chromatiales bacterium (ex Bugula neritina AB1)]
MTLFLSRRVIVTAGASGIGRCIAEAFIREKANVHIVDIDRAAIDAMQQDHPDVSVSCADVSDEAMVDSVFEAQQQRAGGLDTLINCAGIKGPTASVEKIELPEWRRCIEVNLDATFLCCRRAVPMLCRSAESGASPSIVNMSSTAGWHGYPMRSAYSSAKWAVIGLTKSIAMELGESGVRANVICPGTVEGDRMLRVVADEAKQTGRDKEEILDSYRRACSMRELIKGEDIADMALFLSSPSAGKVTGQVMNVDGHLEAFTA